ncbi:uncharacterized protein LOC110695093 [Chenopodium quinoa]|uniref:uncharacterized protein LOC110695093 n=1 Tax=Chenopodium quinoa TaxID=63459 RepID=UPI000B76EAE8|nr:uncharacterized protein LOC110695093 [Chenopodium quinoa]
MRQRRWLEFLTDYHVHIQYHEGKANVVTVALSRKSSYNVNALIVANEFCKDIRRLNLEAPSPKVHATLCPLIDIPDYDLVEDDDEDDDGGLIISSDEDDESSVDSSDSDEDDNIDLVLDDNSDDTSSDSSNESHD